MLASVMGCKRMTLKFRYFGPGTRIGGNRQINAAIWSRLLRYCWPRLSELTGRQLSAIRVFEETADGRIAVLMAQGGEFAFVLYATAANSG